MILLLTAVMSQEQRTKTMPRTVKERAKVVEVVAVLS